MNRVEKLEETLGGEYSGLYGEVVTCDTYRLKQVKFQPDVIFDIGANVGIFARFARTLFPKAKIISVEPDPENCFYFRKFTKDPNTFLIEKALGSGQIFHGLTARNGSGETYLSAGLGYPEVSMRMAAALRAGLVFSNVPAITLSELMLHWEPGMRALLKVDCEGAENTIWQHDFSMQSFREMNYIAMEVHDYALTGEDLPEVIEVTRSALASLNTTHICERDGVHFWATKRI